MFDAWVANPHAQAEQDDVRAYTLVAIKNGLLTYKQEEGRRRGDIRVDELNRPWMCPDVTLEHEELDAAIEEALAKLPEPRRRVADGARRGAELRRGRGIARHSDQDPGVGGSEGEEELQEELKRGRTGSE